MTQSKKTKKNNGCATRSQGGPALKAVNILPFTVPGIYQIHGFKTGKVYIGQSDNGFYCIAQHKKELVLNRYVTSNPTLQKDWNRYGPSNFEHTPG